MPPSSEQDQAPERKVVTALSCGVAVSLASKIGTSVLEEFVPQAVTILQIMGASVRIEAANIITAEFACREMSETDAERAVQAGLDLLSAKRAHPHAAEFELRIGIASGLIWTAGLRTAGAGGDSGHRVAEQASALRERASSDRLYITETTRDFVKGLFEYASEDPIILRNFAEPVSAVAVNRASNTENRFEALHSQRLRFVGRDREFSRLVSLWRLACNGKGQVAFVIGEAGIGKSRLVREVDDFLGTAPAARVTLYGSPHHQNSVLYPFVRLIERLCLLDPSEPLSAKSAKLESFLISLGLGRAEENSLIDSLLGLISGSPPLPAGLNSRKHRERIFQAFLRVIEDITRQGPVLMIFEDLQWADPSSQDLVELIVSHSGNHPLMLIAVARPEFKPAWASGPAIPVLTLPPLTSLETASFVALVSKSREVPVAVRDYIATCTGGIPLFVEELTKVFLESELFATGGQHLGTPRASLVALPVSIQAALLARIERLAEGKEVARVASVLGRRFSHMLLAGVAALDAERLHRGIARLIDAGLLLRRGMGPEASYMFKHVLVQEVAYSTLPGADKKTLHLRAAGLLRAIAKQQADEPETIARHLTEAGESDEAARLWLLAGQCAVSRSANPEAIEHLQAGLKCLRKVPPSESRDRRERQTLMALGPALMAVHGYGATEGRKVFERAAELVDEATPVPERLHILCGLWNIRNGRSELNTALRLAEQFLELARTAGAGLTLGNCMMGQTLAAMGEFKRAHSHFLYVIGQYRGHESGSQRVPFAADEHILALTYMGRVLWALGYPEQAAAATEEALFRARSGADAVSVAIAHVGQLYTATHGADTEQLAANISEAVAHCSRYGLYLFEHWMLFNRGALLVRRGDPRAGIELMRSAIAAAEVRQSRQFRVFQLSCVAEAHLKCRSYEQALTVAEEAVLLAEETGERMSEAGLRRVRAEIFFELGRISEGRRELEMALQLARRQSARFEQLRVATAMTRHAAGGEEANLAGQTLRNIYETFGEGQDLPDLRAARDRLVQLGLA